MLKSQKERKSPRSIEFSESVQVKLQKKGMFEEIVLIQFWSGGAAGICSQPSLLSSVCKCFFAATLPFFFFRGPRFLASLVGDEEDERKCAKVPEMRKSKCLDVRQGTQLPFFLFVLGSNRRFTS